MYLGKEQGDIEHWENSKIVKNWYRVNAVMGKIPRFACSLHQVWKEIIVSGWPGRDPENQGLVFERYAEITGWEKERRVTGISNGRIILDHVGLGKQAYAAQLV